MVRRLLSALLGVAPVLAGLMILAPTSAAQPSWHRGFEHGLGGMQPWYDVQKVGRTTATAHGGSYALDVDASDFWGIEERWPGHHAAIPGVIYRFSGWIKVSPQTTQNVVVTAFFVNNGEWAEVGEATVAEVRASGSHWQRYVGTATAPEGAATVGLRYEGRSATHLYVDDVRIRPAGDTSPTPTPTPTQGTAAPSPTQGTTSPAPDPTTTSRSPSPSPTHRTTTPAPDPTTTSRSPSPSPTHRTTTPAPDPEPSESSDPPARAGDVCTDPAMVFHGQGSGGLGDYYADADIWNPQDIEQTMGVCDHDSWYVDVTASDGNHDGAVQAYPNVHRDYHNWSTGAEPRLDSFRSIDSSFAHTAPGGSGVWNVAYDIWLNGVASNGSTELMIWTQNKGQTPAGRKVATVSLEGHSWDLWASGDNGYIAFVASQPVTSGTFDLKAFTDYLVNHNRLPANSTLGQVDYGVEIVDTGDARRHFDFTGFSVNAVK